MRPTSLKEELREDLLRMLAPLEAHFSEGKARLWLGAQAAGYGVRIAGMEGAMRLLWGLTPYWAGGGTGAERWKETFLQAVKNGTDPDSPEYWGTVGQRDQKIVEMAPLACNLLLTPEVLWEKLDAREKENLSQWLYQANGAEVPDNNWHFFVVLVNVALKKLGRPYSEERIRQGIQRYEDFYLGNGWYSDGQRPQKDYYVSFGIHFYCLLYAHFMEKEDPERCERYRERAALFAETFLYWFDDRGRGIPYGRSMTYRFAQVAFLAAAVTVLRETCPYRAQMKRLLRLHMEHWMAQPVFDNGGVLTVGYQYPNLLMSEGYNSPGSPYWAFKSFFCLALPDGDPFWSLEEAETEWLPRRAVPECNMLFLHVPGQAVALTAGQFPTVVQTHSEAKYAKFAYSSVFGFSVPRSSETLAECAPDSMLAFEVYGKFYVRKRCKSFSVKENGVYARWSAAEGIEVETELIPAPEGYLRRQRVLCRVPCRAYECGFSYPVTEGVKESAQAGEARVWDENGYSGISVKDGAGEVCGTGLTVRAAPNTNLLYPLTGIPAVMLELSPGIHSWETAVEARMRPGRIVTGKGEVYVIEDGGDL